MKNARQYRIHIQQRTEAGQWEDLPIQTETDGFVLLSDKNHGEGVEAALMNVSDMEIALFLAHVPKIRQVIKEALPIFMAADLMGAGQGTPNMMDAEAMLTQPVRRAEGGDG